MAKLTARGARVLARSLPLGAFPRFALRSDGAILWQAIKGGGWSIWLHLSDPTKAEMILSFETFCDRRGRKIRREA